MISFDNKRRCCFRSKNIEKLTPSCQYNKTIARIQKILNCKGWLNFLVELVLSWISWLRVFSFLFFLIFTFRFTTPLLYHIWVIVFFFFFFFFFSREEKNSNKKATCLCIKLFLVTFAHLLIIFVHVGGTIIICHLCILLPSSLNVLQFITWGIYTSIILLKYCFLLLYWKVNILSYLKISFFAFMFCTTVTMSSILRGDSPHYENIDIFLEDLPQQVISEKTVDNFKDARFRVPLNQLENCDISFLPGFSNCKI